MDALFEAIREECSELIWSRAVQLCRNGELNGKRTANGEYELRIRTKGGMVSPLVVLSPHHRDWSCECPSADAVCVHVAAAVIALKRSSEAGTDIPGISAPAVKVAYRLETIDGCLSLERFMADGDALKRLDTRLTIVKRKDAVNRLEASQADIAVDLILSPQISGRIPRAIMPQLLSALANCSDVQLDGQPIAIDEPGPVLRVRVDDHQDGFRLYAVQDETISRIFSNGAVLHGGTLKAIGEIALSDRDLEELRRGRVFTFDQLADLVGRIIPSLKERVPVDLRSEILPKATPVEPRLGFNLHYDGECLNVLTTIVYGDPPSARVDAGKLTYLGGTLPLRNERKEELLIDEISRELDLEVGKTLRFVGLEALKIAERIRLRDDALVQGNGLDCCFIAEPLKTRFALDNDNGYDLAFVSDDGEIRRYATTEAVLNAWRRGESLVPLVEGGWAPLPETVLERCGQVLADLEAFRSIDKKLPQCAIPDLARLCEALEVKSPPEFDRLRLLVENFDGIPSTELPEDLQTTLRAYQVRGVNWLAFLSRANLGALLADDMGLGKTIQALCAVGYPCLVVAPASVVHNWENEIKRFRPKLKQHVYHGPKRYFDPEADITLTTYAILRIDEFLLAERTWDTIVLDEAQNIKNADSQVAVAAFRLQARYRIALSGTPVENRLDELWSQFHFLNRGLLGSRKGFQDRYAKPIAEADANAAERLRQRIRPFVLRRLKREVAKELPARTEIVMRCTLSDRERELYDAIHAATRREVLEKLKAGGNIMAALEALLRLRQACCHSGLIPGQQADGSSKLTLLLETLEAVVAEGHKALVFSQWTSLLDLTEPKLKNAAIPFTRLDGSTRDRASVVQAFQAESGPPVMLISLRAGGVGLNLTAADNVFLLDPWWNPAVEEQAADRTHRIGQERPVLIQRLVTENTVEERMLELQKRKRALARTAIEEGTQAQGITREDLLALLQ
ncbi:MAG: helicase [Deltaproteobacteria bacterium]|nr:helicase [Deltaproteobacteria bacterium]